MSANVARNLDELILNALQESWRCRARALDCVEVEESRRCYRVVSDRGVLSAKVHPLGTFFDDILQGLRVQRYAAEQGITTNAALPTVRGELSQQLDGYGVVVQPWIEGQPFRARPDEVRALGELVGSLHALVIPEDLEGYWSRLEPRRALDRIRDEVFRHRAEVPARHRAHLEAFCAMALQTDDFPSVPRSIIHTDLAWSNVIETGGGRVALIDFEGAGIGPPIVDLVEVTTYIVQGPSGSGPLLVEQAQAFYEGYRRRRRLSAEELKMFPKAHFYHQLFYLANALERGDYAFIDRMNTRLASWEAGILDQIREIAGEQS